MNKLKLFVENFLVYGLGGILNRIIPFIMLPLVTRLMPDTKYFGLNDLVNTVVQFGTAAAIMGLYDAVFRLFFEKEELLFKRKVCSTALVFIICTSLITSLLLLCFDNKLTLLVFGDTKYKILLYFCVLNIVVGATNSIVALPTRVQNKRKVFLSVSFISSVLSYSISIPLLLMEKYLIALPLAAIITAILNELVFYCLNRSWFSFLLFDKEILKNLLKIGLPLLPTFLIYWIFTSSDKLMIANMLGNDEVGLYSVGAKIASASQLIYTAFAGGWQYFAFSTMREENQVKNNSLVFEYLGVISFISAIFACAWSKTFFELFFVGDYVNGYVVTPYLFLGPLLLMLYQVIANQFLVIKKTFPGMFILFTGAVINVALNIYLIPMMGIEGAAIATLTGYAISVCICAIVLTKMNLAEISLKFKFLSLLLIIFMLIWRNALIANIATSTALAIAYVMISVALYRTEILSIMKRMMK